MAARIWLSCVVVLGVSGGLFAQSDGGATAGASALPSVLLSAGRFDPGFGSLSPQASTAAPSVLAPFGSAALGAPELPSMNAGLPGAG